MPRRKAKPPFVLTALGVIVCLLLAGRIISSLSDDLAFFPALAFIVAGAIILFVLVQRRRRDLMFGRVDAITDDHMATLVRQQTILIRLDPYGKPIVDRWLKELDYFLVNHIRPALSQSQKVSLDKYKDAVVTRIWHRVTSAAQQRPANMFDQAAMATMTPAEFEVHCADTLRGLGWTVFQTSMSRDQGVDVIAEKNGVRVALQCKLYANPVGNKAVQEISAGRLHQRAHVGAVVTNSTYTPSAQELASTNGVWLLHYTDLPQLEFMVINR